MKILELYRVLQEEITSWLSWHSNSSLCSLLTDVILCMKFAERITGMFGWVNDWQIAELKVASCNSKKFWQMDRIQPYGYQ